MRLSVLPSQMGPLFPAVGVEGMALTVTEAEGSLVPKSPGTSVAVAHSTVPSASGPMPFSVHVPDATVVSPINKPAA